MTSMIFPDKYHKIRVEKRSNKGETRNLNKKYIGIEINAVKWNKDAIATFKRNGINFLSETS